MLKVSDILTGAEIAQLRRRSDWVGAALVLHAWALILGAMELFALWPNPLTFLVAVMVIGGRQLGIAILMHDAAHGLLFSNRRANEWVATWLCAAPVFTSLQLYRPYHLAHHRHTQQAEDPDLGLSAPFPITRASKPLGLTAVNIATGEIAWRASPAEAGGAPVSVTPL